MGVTLTREGSETCPGLCQHHCAPPERRPLLSAPKYITVVLNRITIKHPFHIPLSYNGLVLPLPQKNAPLLPGHRQARSVVPQPTLHHTIRPPISP